jgi:hypothetical protein
MSKETTKTVPWSKVVLKTEELSGIPRKQIDEVANQIAIGIGATAEENQPKRDGDSVNIESPFGTYEFTRYPAQNINVSDGRTMLRPACVGANVSIPRVFVNKANIGLIDNPTEEAEQEKEHKKTKTA